MSDTCIIEGCDSPIRAKGWCHSHYHRWYRYGNPLYRPPRLTPYEKLESKIVSREDCWITHLGPDKYVHISHGPRENPDHLIGHRVSWSHHNNKPIPEGLLVRHKCDVPGCVNPEHLELGTYKQNTRDMIERDRHHYGERNRRSRLTEEQVISILESDEPHETLAERYGVARTTITAVKRGQNWKHIDRSQYVKE